jgi:hypothetical protein
MLDLEQERQEQQDLEKTTQLLKEEIQAFAQHGNSPCYRDDLEYAIWLRAEIDMSTALLRLLRRGEITVQNLDRENMEATTLGSKSTGD